LPTYEYKCVSCNHQFERFQRMSDEPVKECEICGQPVRRLLFPVAIQFKGDGFYTTDYARRNALATSGTRSGNGGESDSSSGGDGEERRSSSEGRSRAARGTEAAATGEKE